MKNITKIIIITTILLIINLLYQFPDTVQTVNLVNCNDIRPVKLIIRSKGYYPRHLSQCGWNLNDVLIHIILITLPFAHHILDPQYGITRLMRKVIVFITSLLLGAFACYSFLYLIQYPSSVVENIYSFSRSSFIFTVILEMFLAVCWLVKVFVN